MKQIKRNRQKVIFLDRDGVINSKPPEHDYVKSWEEFNLLPTVLEAIKLLKDKNWLVFVVSNQRGVSRGLVSEDVVNKIHTNLNKILKSYGAFIDGFYWCKHDYNEGCDCRKPKPGLIFKAAREFNINLRLDECWLVGDSETDRLCGINAGIKTLIMKTNGSLVDIIKQLIKD